MTESHYHQLKQGVILNNKYRIEKVLGEGGFGITYLAEDTVLELPVAIKEYYLAGYVTRETGNSNTVMPFSGDKKEIYEDGKRKFIKEARSLGKLAGQRGIVAVRDYFEENNTAYIVMEYLDGITLKGYLKQVGGRIPVAHALELVEPVLKSLVEVHKQGIIHRDISPDNIMVLTGNSVKLLDFGAAREVSINGEKSLSVLLKPGYAPEEQYRTRGEQGPWSDIYALCATVYRCITGKVPTESMERIRNDNLKTPSALGVVMDKEKERALMQGLAVFKEKRIQNAKELYECWYGPLQISELGGKADEKQVKRLKFIRKMRKLKKPLIATCAVVAVLVLAFIGMFFIKNKESNVADLPGEMYISSPIVATKGEKLFLRYEDGLLWGFLNSEYGIQQESVLFSDVRLGDIFLGEDDYVYMVLTDVGLIRFASDGSSEIEYMANDAVENTFFIKDKMLYYVKESDGHLYSVDLSGGKETLVTDDVLFADGFTFYENRLFYYATEGDKGAGIYVMDLEKEKTSYLKKSDALGEIACLRSGGKTIYAVTGNGELYMIHPGTYQIEKSECENIFVKMGIYPVENSMQKGFYYVGEDAKKVYFYDRNRNVSEIKTLTSQDIYSCDYVDGNFFFVLEDGSFHYLTQKGAKRDFKANINYFDGSVLNEE